MKDDTVSRAAVMQSLTREYNRRRTGDGLKLAWIEKAVDEGHRKYNVDYDKMARPSRKETGRSAPMSITRTHKHRS